MVLFVKKIEIKHNILKIKWKKGKMISWNLNSQASSATLSFGSSYITAMKVLSSQIYLVIALSNSTVQCLNSTSLTAILTLPIPGVTVQYLLEWSGYLFMSCSDGTLRVYSLTTNSNVKRIIFFDETPYGLLAAYSSDTGNKHFEFQK
jgi:WD40 repeat protein